MIIGITGTISSGKGKVAEIIRDRGFVHHSFSLEIREVAKERKIEIDRKNLEELGNELIKKTVLSRRIIDHINQELKKDPDKNFVIDGLRHPKQVDAFREHEFENPNRRFILIGVDADPKTRFERLKHRKRHGDPETFEEFKAMDDKERSPGGGQEVDNCLAMADFVIENDGNLKELESKVAAVMKEVKTLYEKD